MWSSFPRLFADFWGDAKSQKKKRKLYSASKAKEKYFSEDSEHLQDFFLTFPCEYVLIVGKKKLKNKRNYE